MKATLILAAALISAPALAQQADAPAAPSPGEIVAAAPQSAWVAIAPGDLLVMDLAPDARDKARRVVIQLMPPPFSQPWIANIRDLAKARWWDGLAIVRAQDNYVVQWGDPDGEDAAKARALPVGMRETSQNDYTSNTRKGRLDVDRFLDATLEDSEQRELITPGVEAKARRELPGRLDKRFRADPYAKTHVFVEGWPLAMDTDAGEAWPVHCYGSVGVGRGMSPDAGTGAELYTVIGHAPRHLDRNIAVVGRVIEGIEHLSTLPRGTGPLGFYETPEERTGIAAIRLGSDVMGLPAYQYLSTDSAAFARYADARAHRRDPFFIVPAGGADVCNIPVPVRRTPAGEG